MNILFVCTGNTCRSPMAEGILKSLLKENNMGNININIDVSSAGISAFEGEEANEKAIYTLKNKGIDIKSHKSRQLTKEIINSSDLILTMTNSHKNMILSIMPEHSKKVFTIKEYVYINNGEELAGKNLDIADPYGLNYNDYEKCAEEIEKNLKDIIKVLNNKNQ